MLKTYRDRLRAKAHHYLHNGSHVLDMLYLMLVATDGHAIYSWAAGGLLIVKLIGVLLHEEV